MRLLDYLIIDVRPSFRPAERFGLAPIGEDGAGHPQYLLKYECNTGESSQERSEGQVHLSQAQAEAMSALCAKINIGLVPYDGIMGLDGTTTKVTFVQGMNRIQVEWWQDAPKPWRPVEKLVEMLRQIAERAEVLV
jgi:hypothetical protein